MNSTNDLHPLNAIHLTNAEFNQLSSLVYDQCGIKLPLAKKILLESRLHKRLRKLNMTTFKDYIQYLTSKEGMEQELIKMIDVVSTNKTDFFREPHHFDFLQQTVLPQLMQEGKRMMKVWSAACSTGEEPYTLAMVLQEFARLNRGFDYSIFASDISTEVLQKAASAIYSMDRVSDIPMEYKKKFLLRSKDKLKPTVRIVPELRSKVRFERINFMDTVLPVNEIFDVVFCRNALIYFDRETQLQVVRKLISKLQPGGYFIIGHSESLLQHDLPIKSIKPTIYQRM